MTMDDWLPAFAAFYFMYGLSQVVTFIMFSEIFICAIFTAVQRQFTTRILYSMFTPYERTLMLDAEAGICAGEGFEDIFDFENNGMDYYNLDSAYAMNGGDFSTLQGIFGNVHLFR